MRSYTLLQIWAALLNSWWCHLSKGLSLWSLCSLIFLWFSPTSQKIHTGFSWRFWTDLRCEVERALLFRRWPVMDWWPLQKVIHHSWMDGSTLFLSFYGVSLNQAQSIYYRKFINLLLEKRLDTYTHVHSSWMLNTKSVGAVEREEGKTPHSAKNVNSLSCLHTSSRCLQPCNNLKHHTWNEMVQL